MNKLFVKIRILFFIRLILLLNKEQLYQIKYPSVAINNFSPFEYKNQFNVKHKFKNINMPNNTSTTAYKNNFQFF